MGAERECHGWTPVSTDHRCWRCEITTTWIKQYIAVRSPRRIVEREGCFVNEQRSIPSSSSSSSSSSLLHQQGKGQGRAERDIPDYRRPLPAPCTPLPHLNPIHTTRSHASISASIRSALLRYAQQCIHTIFILKHLYSYEYLPSTTHLRPASQSLPFLRPAEVSSNSGERQGSVHLTQVDSRARA
jgi:hypothetical protein